MRRLLSFHQAIKTSSSDRIGKSSRDDADQGGEGVGGEAHPKQGWREIDQPKRKGRYEPEEKQIAESVFLEALAQTFEPRRRVAGKRLAQGAPGDEKNEIAPIVAAIIAATPPQNQPNRKPPAMVITAPPGSDRATMTA